MFESSHVPLSKWLMAIHLMSASNKVVSAHQLHRMLGITYKAAWFVSHRLRYGDSPTTHAAATEVQEGCEAQDGEKGSEEAMTDDDPPSVTGGPVAPRMPSPPTVDEPRGIPTKLLLAVVDAGLGALIPIAFFLALVGLMLL